MTECPNCEKPIRGASCRLCGWNPREVKPTRPQHGPPHVPETHRPWVPPKLEGEPAAAEHVKAELAKLMAKLKALPPLPRAPRPLSRRLPEVAIDPAIRAEVARAQGEG